MSGIQGSLKLEDVPVVNPIIGIQKEETKFCKWCQTEKPKSDFYHKCTKCKACARAYAKKWQADNREWANKKAQEWRKKNPEKFKKILKTYRDKNKEKLSLDSHNWKIKNKEKLIAYNKKYKQDNQSETTLYNKKYYIDNLESEKARCKLYGETHKQEIYINSKKWYKANPEKKSLYFKRSYLKNPQKFINVARRNTARRKGAKIVEKFKIIEIFERDKWICQICKLPVDKTLKFPNSFSPSLDHIIPLIKGGNHTKANTQLAHLSCNIRKGAKLDYKYDCK